MAIEKGMSPYEAARERTVEENKRKVEALNLRHLTAAVTEAPKTPSPMKQKRRRIVEAAVVAPSPRRRSRRLANLPEVKYAESLPAKIGQWGGEGGQPRDVQRFPHRLIRVLIHTCGYNDAVSAISFDYVGNNGEERHEGPWGGPAGEPKVLELGKSEYINEISGMFGQYGVMPKIVTSLKFVTNQGNSYEYGCACDRGGTRFDIPVQEGQIVGFFGRSGDRLDAVGIYVRG